MTQIKRLLTQDRGQDWYNSHKDTTLLRYWERPVLSCRPVPLALKAGLDREASESFQSNFCLISHKNRAVENHVVAGPLRDNTQECPGYNGHAVRAFILALLFI